MTNQDEQLLTKEQRDYYNRVVAFLCWIIKSNEDRAKALQFIDELVESIIKNGD